MGIGWVWLGCAIGWMILGSTLHARSGSSASAMRNEVSELWGPAVVQRPPVANPEAPVVPLPNVMDVESYESVGGVRADIPPTPVVAEPVVTEHRVAATLIGSDLQVELDTEQRQKGLSWFPTYAVRFDGAYAWEMEGSGAVRFVLPLDGAGDGFDGFEVSRDGEPLEVEFARGSAVWADMVRDGEVARYRIRFASRGIETWQYQLTEGTGEVRDFAMQMRVDEQDIDFPAGSLAPSAHATGGDGWEGEWRFSRLVSSDVIGVALPRKLDPGPVASRITFFGPVGLLFFFFVIGMVTQTRRRRETALSSEWAQEARAQSPSLHPMHYFFFGCGFFAFHLLFAYLVDHLPLMTSFALSALTSVALVVSYARLFVGWRFALSVMGAAQLVYLVLFSASFFVEGFTGLSVTLGAIGTLFVMMQLTGRTDWGRTEPVAVPSGPAHVATDSLATNEHATNFQATNFQGGATFPSAPQPPRKAGPGPDAPVQF